MSLSESHPYVAAFIDGVPMKSLPLYMGMVIVIGWLLFITLTVMSMRGGSSQQAGELARVTKPMLWLFTVLPFFYGVTSVVSHWWGERQ